MCGLRADSNSSTSAVEKENENHVGWRPSSMIEDVISIGWTLASIPSTKKEERETERKRNRERETERGERGVCGSIHVHVLGFMFM